MWWVLYAVVVCLGMLTQYLIAFLWAVQAVWMLARTLHTHPARGDASSWRWLAAYALAVILYLPWLPHAIDQFRHNVLPSLKGMFGPGRLAELVTAWLTGLDASHLTGFVTLGLLAVAGVLLWSRPRVAAAWRPLVLMWVAPAIVLIVVAAIRELLYAPYGGFFTVRYSCAFQPFVYATMGLVVAGLALRRWNDGGATATTVETETPIGEAAAGQCTPGSAAGVPGSSWSPPIHTRTSTPSPITATVRTIGSSSRRTASRPVVAMRRSLRWRIAGRSAPLMICPTGWIPSPYW